MGDDNQAAVDSSAVILARVEVKLDHALKRGDDHEIRIRALETARWKLSGFAAGIGAIVGGGVGALAKVLGG